MIQMPASYRHLHTYAAWHVPTKVIGYDEPSAPGCPNKQLASEFLYIHNALLSICPLAGRNTTIYTRVMIVEGHRRSIGAIFVGMQSEGKPFLLFLIHL
jgi:hypothetical protein